ncbi:hypothetical protein FQA39_LY11741 [Lamprigera yunnana]|nr:hypothetical protein FQA39_LY11741 [Lamprigera yunnana]
MIKYIRVLKGKLNTESTMKSVVILVILAVVSVKSTTEPSDVFKFSAEAIARCAKDKAEEDKFKELVYKMSLPVNDEDFIRFYECYAKEFKFIDSEGKMNLDVVRSTYPEFIKQKVSAVLDAVKLTNEAIAHCEKEPAEGSLGLVAIIRRNCANKYISGHLH